MEYYVIRSKITGLYSSGGTIPSFTKHGKIWRAIGPVKSHLRLVGQHNGGFNCYANCEIVTLKLSSEPCKADLATIMHDLEQDLIVKKLKGNA